MQCPTCRAEMMTPKPYAPEVLSWCKACGTLMFAGAFSVPAQAKSHTYLRTAAGRLRNHITANGTDIPPRLLVDLDAALDAEGKLDAQAS